MTSTRQLSNCPCATCKRDTFHVGYKCNTCGTEIVLAPINPVDVSNGTAARANSAAIRKRGRSFTIGRKKKYANAEDERAARLQRRRERKALGYNA